MEEKEKINKYLFICDQPHEHWYQQIYNDYYPESPHNSKHLFDIYTLTHIFWSALITLILKKFMSTNYAVILTFLVTAAFEIFENLDAQIIKYRRIEVDSTGKSSYRGDSFINSIGDIIGNMIGIYIGITLSNQNTLIILLILFLVITNIVGFSYWTDFFQFLS